MRADLRFPYILFPSIANLNNVAVGGGDPGGRRCQLPLLWNVKRGKLGERYGEKGMGLGQHIPSGGG